jgi:uncharacterized protein YggU (UPF0235/DUF167 family)
LAKFLDVRRGDISIERGERGRDKEIAVATIDPSAVLAAVARLEAVT